MRVTLAAMIMAGAVCAAGAASAAEDGDMAGPTFQNFSGVCQSGGINPELKGALGWDRHDLDWHGYEPARGEFHEKFLDTFAEKVLKDQAEGLVMLPMIGYGAAWARVEELEYSTGPGEKAHVKRLDGDGYRYACTKSTLQPDGTWKAGKTEEHSNLRLPFQEQYIPDWERFIEVVVTKLMAPPYNLRYFQVWNEPWPTSGFFDGGMDDYMTTVHLPAARVIQRLGGKVVFGGWACCGPLSTFVDLLDRHDAWGTIDVMDIHYMPLGAFAYLDRAMKDRGFQKPLWQTELGFSSDPNFIGNTYPRFLRWGLERGWSDPDAYKLFFFANWAPSDPKAWGYNRSLNSGDGMSGHGYALKTLAELLGGGALERYDAVRTVPALKPEIDERLSSLEAFRVGDRLVIALHLLENNNGKIFIDWNGDGDSIHLNHDEPTVRVILPGLAPGGIAAIERVGQFGQRLDLTPAAVAADGGVALDVPVRERRERGAAFVEMPEDTLAQTFYLNVRLR